MDSSRQTRREFLRASAGYGAALVSPWALVPDPEIEALIRRAGSVEDDSLRYRLLRQVGAHPRLDAALGAELEPILKIAHAWAHGRERALERFEPLKEHSYLNNFFGRVEPDEHPQPVPREASPLYPVWALYRGRVILWYAIEMGWIRADPRLLSAYNGEGQRLLAVAERAFPENRVIGMYLGRDLPWPPERSYPPDPTAPEWANLQREGLEKVSDIIHWWMDHRELPNGEYGGGWNDDVEMWRWWAPVLIGFRDPEIEAAQERLSSAIFRMPHMAGGFTSKMSDVEHTAEDSADTITPMMHLAAQDPVWQGRARRLAELMRDRWTGRNRRGELQFRSVYFTADQLDEAPQRAIDVAYNVRTLQPALLLWQRTGDPELEKLFTDWLRTWVAATARAEAGKPAGILPTAIHWPDGTPGGLRGDWWDPDIFEDGREEAYYNWPSRLSEMSSILLLAFHRTGEAAFLGPIRSMADLWRKHHAAPAAGAKPGSEAWAAAQIGGFLPTALAKYRLLTGQREFDDLLFADPDGYLKFRFHGDVSALETGLRRSAEAVRYNFPAYTDQVRYTDRVAAWGTHYRTLQDPNHPILNPQLLYASATGDLDWAGYFPVNAVRWLTLPREIAALVREADPSRFSADLYHFGIAPREIEAELYLLAPGAYALTLTGPDGRELARQALRVDGPTTRVQLSIPPRTLVRVSVRG